MTTLAWETKGKQAMDQDTFNAVAARSTISLAVYAARTFSVSHTVVKAWVAALIQANKI